MRKAKTVLSLVGMMMLGFCAISVMAAQNDFSGVWTLNKQKTHGLPKDLKGFTLVVTQNEQQLVVKTRLEGGVQAKAEDSNMTNGGTYLTMWGGAGGYRPGTLALSVVMPQLTYSLDGKETTAEGVVSSITSKLKAKWSKDGKTLDLSLVQKDTASMQQGTTDTIKERWTLSAGGDVLKVQRSVGTAGGSDAITLIFGKETSGTPTPQH